MWFKANQVRPETPGTPDELAVTMELGETAFGDEIVKKKPAILGSEGTSVKVSLTARPPPQPHPSTLKRKYRGSKSDFSSLIVFSLLT